MFGFSLRRHANVVRLGVGEQVPVLEFGFRIDNFGLRRGLGIFHHQNVLRFREQPAAFCVGLGADHFCLSRSFGGLHLRGGVGFGVLDRRFLAGFGFEARLLDLLLLERQRVLHRIGFSLGHEHARLRVGLGMLDLADLRGFGLRFRDLHFLLLDLRVNTCAIVLLLFFKQAFKAARIFLRQFHFSEQHFLYDDSVFGQPRRDCLRGFLAILAALDGEKIAHDVIRTQVAKRAGHNRLDNFLVNRLRQIRLNVSETRRVDAITHGKRESHGQTFARFNVKHFELFLRSRAGRCRENLVAHVIQGNAFGKWENRMRPGIESSRTHAGNLAHAHTRVTIGHDDETLARK